MTVLYSTGSVYEFAAAMLFLLGVPAFVFGFVRLNYIVLTFGFIAIPFGAALFLIELGLNSL